MCGGYTLLFILFLGLPAMLKCPKNHFQAAAIFLPGIMCTLLLANRPHMNVLLSVRDADGIHSEDYVRSGRVLLSDESNNNTPALDVHVSLQVTITSCSLMELCWYNYSIIMTCFPTCMKYLLLTYYF